MKFFISAIFVTLMTLEAKAQESQTGYNFLRLPVSAHAAALGGDNITLVEDDEALIFHNPALLSTVSDKTINLNYMNYMQGANTASAAFNRIVKERASWAVSAQYIDYGTMKEVDENNQQTGTFSARDISGVDLGLNYYDPDREWSISLVAKNLGGQVKAYEDDYEKMPIDVQLGVSKRILRTPFRISATLVDLNHWNYSFINHAVVGVDLLLGSGIWIGGGYNFRRADEMKVEDAEGEESSHWAGASIGAGIYLERFKVNVAYGKYHVSSSSLVINAAYTL